jgi:hypothetical protein
MSGQNRFEMVKDEAQHLYIHIAEGQSRGAPARQSAKTLWQLMLRVNALSYMNKEKFLLLPVREQRVGVKGLLPFTKDGQVKLFLKFVADCERIDKNVRQMAKAALASTRSRARKRQQTSAPTAKELEWFTGTVNRIDAGSRTVYATLFDQDNREYAADFDLAVIQESGLDEGDDFFCIVTDEGEKSVVTLIRREPQEVSPDVRAAIGDKIEQAFQGFEDDDEPADAPYTRPSQ